MPTLWSRAALRTWASGFPRSPATWPLSTCEHLARLSEPSASKAASAAASSTTTPIPISCTATFASTPTPRTTSASTDSARKSSFSPPARISSTAPSKFPRLRRPRSASPAQPAPDSWSTSAAQPNNPVAAKVCRIVPLARSFLARNSHQLARFPSQTRVGIPPGSYQQFRGRDLMQMVWRERLEMLLCG